MSRYAGSPVFSYRRITGNPGPSGRNTPGSGDSAGPARTLSRPDARQWSAHFWTKAMYRGSLRTSAGPHHAAHHRSLAPVERRRLREIQEHPVGDLADERLGRRLH